MWALTARGERGPEHGGYSSPTGRGPGRYVSNASPATAKTNMDAKKAAIPIAATIS